MSCYYPNGDLSSGGDIPCSNGNGVACCPLNWSCQSNGLCYLANANYYGRYTCTDQSWQSPGCPNICTHSLTAAGDEAVLECTTGNYCCDANRPTDGCCDTTTSRFQLSNLGSSPASPASSSSTSSSSSAQQTSTSTPTSSSPPTSSASPSTTATPTLRSITLDTSSASTPSSRSSSSSSEISSSPSTIVVTSVITSNGGGTSTLITSTSSIATSVPASTTPVSAPPKKNLGSTIGPAVAVPLVVIALAVLAFFLYRRRKQKKQTEKQLPFDEAQGPGPQPMYGASGDAKDLVDSPYTGKSELEGSPKIMQSNGDGNGYHTPDDVGAGGATYRGVSGISNQTTAVGSPAVGTFRDSKELAASPTTARSRRSELPGSGMVRDAVEGGGQQQPAELPGTTYRPYRPPGLGVTQGADDTN